MTVVVTCPSWEYTTVSGYADILKRRATALLLLARGANTRSNAERAKDTRQVHGDYFTSLTPPGFPHYAGHYRGEKLTCLTDYEVNISSDARVGHTAATVPMEMAEFAIEMGRVIADLDYVWSINERIFDSAQKLYRTIQLAAALFVYFLEIHPYANGNGHMARFIVVCLLARHQVYPARWPVDPRPPDPPYSELISRYRSGDHDPLERFVMSLI